MEKPDYHGLITVRTLSKRLPNKCLLPFGKETVISHVVKRTISYGIEPIICTTTHSSDDVLQDLAETLNVRSFRGSSNNKLKRWLDCAEKFSLDYFHTIDADDPFFNGVEVIDSLKLLRSENYDVVCPAKSSSDGGASVGYSLTKDIVKRALADVPDDSDTEMMWYYLERLSGIKSQELPESDDCLSNVRLTLDYEEDYWLLASIVRLLGHSATRAEIKDLFFRNPDLRKINLFRNDEWKALQLSKKI